MCWLLIDYAFQFSLCRSKRAGWKNTIPLSSQARQGLPLHFPLCRNHTRCLFYCYRLLGKELALTSKYNCNTKTTVVDWRNPLFSVGRFAFWIREKVRKKVLLKKQIADHLSIYNCSTKLVSFIAKIIFADVFPLGKRLMKPPPVKSLQKHRRRLKSVIPTSWPRLC